MTLTACPAVEAQDADAQDADAQGVDAQGVDAQGVDTSAKLPFHVDEVLHNPTTEGVTLSFCPAEDVLVRVEYGDLKDGLLQTTEQAAAAGEMVMLPLGKLAPGREFQYQLVVRRSEGAPEWRRPVHHFRTLREVGGSFSFAVLADPHAWAMWTRKACGSSPGGYDVMKRAMTNIRADESIDFVVVGTDSVMTLCGNGCKSCKVSGERVAQGDSTSLRDAELRYRAVLSKDIYGLFAADKPMLYMLGDHDGEKGWTIDGGAGEYTKQQQDLSFGARRQSIPNAYASYGGDPKGAYYALRTGDLLLVVLAAQRYSSEIPMGPDNWSLGEAQLIWLEETLGESDAAFKIVTAEHLVGGSGDPDGPSWKARGGLKATDNGEINGTFLGEQFLIHEMMKEHGAQLFLSFHDHIVAWGEKVNADFEGEGVFYAIGGQGAAAGPPTWSSHAWYKAEMDYDNDGVPEYQSGKTGTLAKGHFKVTVHGTDQMVLDYIEASTNKRKNGRTVLSFTIDGPGESEADN